MFGNIVFFYFDSLLMLCYAFNLLMAFDPFDRLLLKGLLTYLLFTTYIDRYDTGSILMSVCIPCFVAL